MYNQSYDQFQFGFMRIITPMVKRLLIVNFGVFLLQQLVVIFYHESLIKYFGLIPSQVVKNLAIWQLGTYMFLHGGWMHLLFNMFGLWMFGTEIERQWGEREFLWYYLITGIGAGIFTILFNIFTPYADIPTIGASGAIFGILLAFGMIFPNRYIYLYFFFPVKAKYFVMIFGMLTLFSVLSYNPDGIAHFAHLGGMVVGFIYIKTQWHLDYLVDWWREFKARRRIRALRRRRQESINFKEEVDRVLDRINEVGYENLTKEEKRILQKASLHLSRSEDNK